MHFPNDEEFTHSCQDVKITGPSVHRNGGAVETFECVAAPFCELI
jgi:hypothetical protein